MQENRQLSAAYEELRHVVAEGQVRDAEAIGERIGEILAQEYGDDELSPVTLHTEAFGWLLTGISATLSGDHHNAISTLRQIADRSLDNTSIRWAALLWICWAALELGDLDRAYAATYELSKISNTLDERSHSIGLVAKADVDAANGEWETAMESLSMAGDICEQLGDVRGLATVCLALARTLASMDRDLDSVFAARKALSLTPDWEAPVIFLATMSLKEGNLDYAEQQLADLDRLGPRPEEAHRLGSIMVMVREERVPLWIVTDYLRLREALPSEAIIGEIQALTLNCPALYHLREVLAWKLIKLGRLEEAQAVVDQLLEEEIDPAVRASTMLAASSLASLREPDRPPGAKVHAAVSAGPAEEAVLEAEPPPQPGPTARAGDEPKDEPRDEQWVQRAVDTLDGKKSVFSGDLSTLGPADLLEFLRNGRRTGTLVLRSKNGSGAIYLRSGMITNGSSPHSANIGDLLLERGAISQAQLGDVASSQRVDGRGSLMGAMFVERGMVDAETIKGALKDQVFTAIRELFQWHQGQFAFLPDPAAASSERAPSVEIELDPQYVLLEVARTIDEESR